MKILLCLDKILKAYHQLLKVANIDSKMNRWGDSVQRFWSHSPLEHFNNWRPSICLASTYVYLLDSIQLELLYDRVIDCMWMFRRTARKTIFLVNLSCLRGKPNTASFDLSIVRVNSSSIRRETWATKNRM